MSFIKDCRSIFAVKCIHDLPLSTPGTLFTHQDPGLIYVDSFLHERLLSVYNFETGEYNINGSNILVLLTAKTYHKEVRTQETDLMILCSH